MMNKKLAIPAIITFLILTIFIGIACDDAGTTTSTVVPAVYQKIYGATQLYIEGDYVVIKTNGRPEHKSPYYLGTQWENTLYEADPDTSFHMNPNRIAEFSMTYKIPLNPTVASTHQTTPMGPMGVVINGVAFFNQYAAGGTPLTNEIASFDQYGGHPQQQGQYHYHLEPDYITTTRGDSTLMGFLLDGFPVYGPRENGAVVTNANLDLYHGHTGVKEDYPNGIYHYHITSESPYINGDGFYGTPGTVTY